MKGWTEKTLGALGTIGRGRSRHRPRDAKHLYGGPYPFIQTADVKRANLYIDSYNQTYSDAGLAQSKLWEPGTLCITIAANIAETAILKIQACFPDSVIGFIPHEKISDVRFVKYLFDAILKKKFESYSKGSTQDNLSQEKILSLKFFVPAFEVQQKIGDILSAYDDLIENNRRRIQLLEESARMLYKEWFVRLRFPGHEHVKVVDGVPEGWETVFLGDVLLLQRGFDLPAQQRKKGKYPVCASNGICGYHNEYKVTGPGVVTGRSGSLGLVSLVAENFWPLNTVLWVKEYKKTTPYHANFLLESLSLARFNGGAAVPTLNRNDVHALKILFPPNWMIKEFSKVAQSFFLQQISLKRQNHKLAQARDLLLPKLMSGEVTV